MMLKIADLGLARAFTVPIKKYTHEVASLLHDDVLDDADTRRGIGSLNSVMGNKLALLAGDFLLSRACVALASLKNTEVVSLLAKVVEHLVNGEAMQMTSSSDERCSLIKHIWQQNNLTENKPMDVTSTCSLNGNRMIPYVVTSKFISGIVMAISSSISTRHGRSESARFDILSADYRWLDQVAA